MASRRRRKDGRGGGNTVRRSEQPPPVDPETTPPLRLVPKTTASVRRESSSSDHYSRFSQGISTLLDTDYSCFHRIRPGPLGDAERVGSSRGPLPARCAGPGFVAGENPAAYGFQWSVGDGLPGVLRACACRAAARGPFSDGADAASAIVPRFLARLIGRGSDRSDAPRLGVEIEPLPVAAAEEQEAPLRPRRTRRLSLRETQVLQLHDRGQTRKEIASALGLEEETVKTYVKRIAEKDPE